MIGTAPVDKFAQEDDQVIWDPALVKWTPHEKTLHECPGLTLQAMKVGSACVLCSAWPALCDLTIRAPGGVGRYASNMTKYATVFISLWPQCERYINRIYAAGAEPQWLRETQELEKFHMRWSRTCKTFHKRVTSNMFFDLNWIRATHNAKEYFFIQTFITSNTMQYFRIVTIIISVEA